MTHKTESKVSRFCSVLGCAFNLTSTTTALLGLFLPFWVYVNDVLETNTYELTENTNVIYNYGLLQYCVRLKSTHLDIDECGRKGFSNLADWEKMTLVSVASGAGLNALSFLLVVVHLRCCYRHRPLVTAVCVTLFSGAVQGIGVSAYQICASKLVLNIEDVTTTDFRLEFFSGAFWLAVISAGFATIAGMFYVIAAFTWRRPVDHLTDKIIEEESMDKENDSILVVETHM